MRAFSKLHEFLNSTFGYYSTIDLGSPKSMLNVATFAKKLLSDLKFTVHINEEYKYGSVSEAF